MRVLLVTGIFPPDIGGPATYVPQIAGALSSRGHQVTVLTLSDCLDHDDTEHPFPIVRLSRRAFKPWRLLRTVGSIFRLGGRADVLFVNGLAIEVVVANFLLRKPLVMKIVGDFAWERSVNRGWIGDGFEEFQQRRYGPRVEWLRSLRSWWIRRAHLIIVPSRYLARWVSGWGVPEHRLKVVLRRGFTRVCNRGCTSTRYPSESGLNGAPGEMETYRWNH